MAVMEIRQILFFQEIAFEGRSNNYWRLSCWIKFVPGTMTRTGAVVAAIPDSRILN